MSKDISETLIQIDELIDNSDLLSYQKHDLKNAVNNYKNAERTMTAYFNLEDWLYNAGGKDKPVEIKSAMVWGGLWIVKEMGNINWDTMRNMYGEFMSKQMNLR